MRQEKLHQELSPTPKGGSQFSLEHGWQEEAHLKAAFSPPEPMSTLTQRLACLSSMSGQGRKSHPLAAFSGWLSHPGCPSLSWVLGIVGQGTTFPMPPLLSNLRRRPVVSSWVITMSVTNGPDSRLLKACEHCLLGENGPISCLGWWESKWKQNCCVSPGEGQVLVSKQADLGKPSDSLLGGLLTHSPWFSMNCGIIPKPQSPRQSDLRKLHVHEGGKNTQSLGLPWGPQGPIQSFKNASGKNSPALNPACSTSKQVKAPQNAQSWWSIRLLRQKVFPPEHHKWDKLHNRIIRVVAERCNHKVKGLFKIWGWLVLIQERNIKESNSKVPASSCYRDTVMAKCQRVLSATTDLPLSSSAAALFLLLA